MPNRRAHDHIGQLRQKLSIRIGKSTTDQVINNLKKLADANMSVSDIDKIVTKVLNDPKFRTLFIKNMKAAVDQLATNTPDVEAAARGTKG